MTWSSPSSETDKSLVTTYERLRTQVLSGRIQGVRNGLAIIVQKGMAAWMEICSSCRQTITKKRLVTGEEGFSDEHYPAIVDLMTNMVLSQMKEIWT